MKTVFRLSVLVMIGLLCVAGYAKQKEDVPPVAPGGDGADSRRRVSDGGQP